MGVLETVVVAREAWQSSAHAATRDVGTSSVKAAVADIQDREEEERRAEQARAPADARAVRPSNFMEALPRHPRFELMEVQGRLARMRAKWINREIDIIERDKKLAEHQKLALYSALTLMASTRPTHIARGTDAYLKMREEWSQRSPAQLGMPPPIVDPRSLM